MKRLRINLYDPSEYHYGLACGFMPNLRAYLHEEKDLPCMIIVPGGGYEYAASGEADLVARRFYDAGFQAFVLTYSTNPLKRFPLHTQPMRDLARAVRVVRHHAQELGCEEQNLILLGFSAGAHVCASVCVHHEDLDTRADLMETEQSVYQGISCRPDAAFLSYPVITMGEYAHKGSVISLLGETPSEEELNYFSLETQVTEKTPPCFVWHTVDDASVPMENSLLFSMALKKAGVPFAYHLFSHGQHGLSLSNAEWAKGHFAENYTFEHAGFILKAIQDGTLPASEEELAKIDELAHRVYGEKEAMPEVEVWPELALSWLKTVQGRA